jgi:hypothetical protein
MRLLGQRVPALVLLLICGVPSFQGVEPGTTSLPAAEWDGQGILVPKLGQLHPHNQDIRVVFDGSRAMQSASYSSAWSWSMWVNDLKQATISLTPTAPKVDFKIKGPPPGRYAIFFKLHAGEHGEVEGQRVVFFVDQGNVSSLANLEHAATSRVSEKRDALIEWAQTHGKGFTKVRIGSDQYGGNTMFATHDMEEGEVIGELPYSVGFNAEGVFHASSKQSLWEELYKDKRVPNEIVTSMFLLSEIEAGNASFFAPYIDLLPPPSRLQNSIYWDTNFQRLIQSNPRIVGIWDAANKKFESQYARLFSIVESLPSYRRYVDFPIFARQAMKWAFCLLLTRCWVWGQLIPVVDIPNHVDLRNRPPNAGYVKINFDDTAMRVRAIVLGGPVKAGEEIVVCYGHRDNSMLLAHFGFTMWPNAFDRVGILPTLYFGTNNPPVPAPLVKFKEVPAPTSSGQLVNHALLEKALQKGLAFKREEITHFGVLESVLDHEHFFVAGGKYYQVMDPSQEGGASVAACEVGAYWCEHGRLPGLTIEAWEYHRTQVMAQAQVWEEAAVRDVSTWRAVYAIKSALASGERAVGRLLLELLTLRNIFRSLVRASKRMHRAKAECQKQSADASVESLHWPEGDALEGWGKRDMRPLREMACTLAERDAAILAATTKQVHKEWMVFLRALKELACKAKFGSLWRTNGGWCGEESRS